VSISLKDAQNLDVFQVMTRAAMEPYSLILTTDDKVKIYARGTSPISVE